MWSTKTFFVTALHQRIFKSQQAYNLPSLTIAFEPQLYRDYPCPLINSYWYFHLIQQSI
jgi:hypothetical protein